MNMPSDWSEEADLLAKAEAWVAEVSAAYDDGGYASGDGPTAPLDEMEWLIAERKKALRIIEAWHQLYNHLDRMVTANPSMRLVDAVNALESDHDRIKEARRG